MWVWWVDDLFGRGVLVVVEKRRCARSVSVELMREHHIVVTVHGWSVLARQESRGNLLLSELWASAVVLNTVSVVVLELCVLLWRRGRR